MKILDAFLKLILNKSKTVEKLSHLKNVCFISQFLTSQYLKKFIYIFFYFSQKIYLTYIYLF